MALPERRLAAIDLNLLVALDALLGEESVTAAGRSVGMSQPAMSHALSRLRELLNDELLVREGRGMRKTLLAQHLAPKVQQILGDIEATLTIGQRFEPANSQRTFRVATDDYCGAVLLPKAISRICRAAPHVKLDCHHLPEQVPAHQLAHGDLDLVLGTYRRVKPPLRSRRLFSESFVCLLRRGHPLRGRLTLKRYIELDHVLIASPGYGAGVADHALAMRGLERRVPVRLPHFMVAPAVVAASDMLLTLPRRLGLAVATRRHRVVQPPLELSEFSTEMVWHMRSEEEPGNRWLRQQLLEAANEL